MLVTVATFDAPEPAQALSREMEASGIPTEIVDETNLQQFWFGAPETHASYRLKIEKSELPQAETFLRQAEAAQKILRSAIRCPECGSSRVEYPQFTRKSLLAAIPSLLCRLRLIKAEFFCEDCQYTWVPGKRAGSGKSPTVS